MTELLCIQTHSQGFVVAGNTYPLIRTAKLKCGCGINDVVGIGHKPRPGCVSGCNTCNTDWGLNTRWYSSELFAEIGTTDECEQYEKELIKQPV